MNIQSLIDFHKGNAKGAECRKKDLAIILSDKCLSNNQRKRFTHEMGKATKRMYQYRETADILLMAKEMMEGGDVLATTEKEPRQILCTHDGLHQDQPADVE